jgi:hypothetical protein
MTGHLYLLLLPLPQLVLLICVSDYCCFGVLLLLLL